MPESEEKEQSEESPVEKLAKLATGELDVQAKEEAPDEDDKWLAERIGEKLPETSPEEESTPPEKDGDATAEPHGKREGGEDLEKALSALRRDKVPQKVLDALSDEEVLEWGQRLAEKQSKTDNAYRELGELKKKQVESKPEAEESVAPGAPAVDPAAFDRLVDPLSDYLDEKQIKTFKDGLSTVITSQARAIAEEATATLRAQMAQAVDAMSLREARRDLAAQPRFKRLAEKESWDRVLARAQKFDVSQYSSYEELLSDAFRAEYGEVVDPEALAENKSKKERREAGTPATSSRPEVPKPQTVSEAEDAWLRKHGYAPT